MEPFVKTGGLGDVSGALPRALAELGIDIEVLCPLHREIDRSHWNLRISDSLRSTQVRVGDQYFPVTFWETPREVSPFDIRFVDIPQFFDRPGVYTEPVSKESYWDNGGRFGGFCLAALSRLEQSAGAFNIVHVNDAHCALLPVFLRLTHVHNPVLRRLRTLLTIHNLEHQGQYDKSLAPALGLPGWTAAPMGPLEFYDKLNSMKGGINYSDKINTVSPRYARETMENPDFGFGLETVLRSRRDDYSGILNGVDLGAWNPSTDKYLTEFNGNFSIADLSAKAVCKARLHAEFDLPAEAWHRPTIGIVSRLAYQKGFDMFLKAADRILGAGLNLTVVGTGRDEDVDGFNDLMRRNPDRCAFKAAFSDRLAHLVTAGADLLVMPSRYEPGGLNQVYAMRYGTAPVVRGVGGLADTVRNFDPVDSPDG